MQRGRRLIGSLKPLFRHAPELLRLGDLHPPGGSGALFA